MSLPFDYALAGQSRGRNTGRILLIEDSKTFASILTHRFSHDLGLDVTVCASTKALREAIAEGGAAFDVAVVDLNLPDSPNGEVLDVAVENGIPVIVFTATFNREIRERIVARGVADYIIKSNDLALDMVVAAVQRMLSNRAIKVLVVDDLSSARQVLVSLLKAQQFQVFEAGTGKEAMAILDRHPDVQLVITDYNMPDVDGYELTRRIRRLHSSDRLRIIGISSSSDRLLSASFLKAGASDFVYRPFVAEELQCRINHNIETLSQIRQLRSAAFCDYLTGLYNRRYFFDTGPALVGSNLRNGVPCCVAMLDVDHFKKLNDTYGHEGGDQVLKALAARLADLLEEGGHLLARLGGEEFGMLLNGFDSRSASQFCDELRQTLSEITIHHRDNQLSITVSIGVAEVVGGESFDNYLNAADQFLYMAKRHGRNQVYSDVSIIATMAAR